MEARRRGGDAWWAPRLRGPQDTTSTPRLIAGKVGFGKNFTLDARQGTLYHSTVAIVRPDPNAISPYYLLGVLNSELFWLFIQHRMPTIGAERYICRILTLRDFPLVVPEGLAQSTCSEIAALARKLCIGSLQGHHRQDIQSQVNTLVTALYGVGYLLGKPR